MMNRNISRFIAHIMAAIIATMISFSPIIVNAQTETPSQAACSSPGTTIPDAWKTKFPFALVVWSGSSQESSECPKIDFMGKTREICSPLMLIRLVKWVVLFRFMINGLFNL